MALDVDSPTVEAELPTCLDEPIDRSYNLYAFRHLVPYMQRCAAGCCGP